MKQAKKASKVAVKKGMPSKAAAKVPVGMKAKAGLPGVTPRGLVDPSAPLANHWSKHPKLKTLTDLPQLVRNYEGARVRAKEAEEEKTKVRGAILTDLQLAGIAPSTDENEAKVACMGFEVFYTKGQGRVIQERFEQELIQRGCPSDIMEAAREAARGEGPVTLQVRPIKALDVEGSKQ